MKRCIRCHKELDILQFNKKCSKCKSCLAEYKREHYQANKEKISQKAKQYRETNAENIKEQKKQYREQNKDIIKEQSRASRVRNREQVKKTKREWAKKKYEPTKFLNQHKQNFKPILDELLLNTNSKLCNICNVEYRLVYFKSKVNGSELNNCELCRTKKQQHNSKEYNVKRQKDLREHKKQLRYGKSCIDCGITDWRILEFDHIDPKEKIKNVSACSTIETMTSEASKCELRCVCCHRLKTVQNGKAQGAGYTYLNEVKLNLVSCKICELLVKPHNTILFDFDHIDKTNKENGVSSLVGSRMSRERIDKEIAKTRLLCCNCHRLHTLKSLYNQDGFYDD